MPFPVCLICVSATYNFIGHNENLLTSSYGKQPVDSLKHQNLRTTASVSINHKFGTRYSLRSGVMVNNLSYNLDIKSRNLTTGIFQQVNKGKGNSNFVQAFIESRTDVTNEFFISAGLYFQYLSLNNRYAFEPRLAVHWQVSQKRMHMCHGFPHFSILI